MLEGNSLQLMSEKSKYSLFISKGFFYSMRHVCHSTDSPSCDILSLCFQLGVNRHTHKLKTDPSVMGFVTG